MVSGKDTFTKTTQEITEYIGCEFNDAREFQTGMVEMRLSPLTELTPPADDDDAIKFKLGRWPIEPMRNRQRPAIVTLTESMHLFLDSVLKLSTTGWRPASDGAISMRPWT